MTGIALPDQAHADALGTWGGGVRGPDGQIARRAWEGDGRIDLRSVTNCLRQVCADSIARLRSCEDASPALVQVLESMTSACLLAHMSCAAHSRAGDEQNIGSCDRSVPGCVELPGNLVVCAADGQVPGCSTYVFASQSVWCALELFYVHFELV